MYADPVKTTDSMSEHSHAATRSKQTILQSTSFEPGFLMRIFDASAACGGINVCKGIPDQIPNVLVFKTVVPKIKFDSASSFKYKALPKAFVASFDGEFLITDIGTYSFCCEAGTACRIYVDGTLVLSAKTGRTCKELRLIPDLHVIHVDAMNLQSARAVVTYNGPDTKDSDKQVRTLACKMMYTGFVRDVR